MQIKIKDFLKQNWFKISIVFILFVVGYFIVCYLFLITSGQRKQVATDIQSNITSPSKSSNYYNPFRQNPFDPNSPVIKVKVKPVQPQASTPNVAVTPPATIQDFSKDIVRVVCTDGNKNNPTYSSGSGTIFGPNKVVVTNSHVVAGMAACSVGLTDDVKNPPSRWYETTSDSSGSSLDITILTPTQPLPQDAGSVLNGICNANDIKLGDQIMILGYPGVGGNTITETEGIVSGFEGYYVKTSAKIEHGNSGGGAFLEKDNCWFGIPSASVPGELESLGIIINFSMLYQEAHQ